MRGRRKAKDGGLSGGQRRRAESGCDGGTALPPRPGQHAARGRRATEPQPRHAGRTEEAGTGDTVGAAKDEAAHAGPTGARARGEAGRAKEQPRAFAATSRHHGRDTHASADATDATQVATNR